MRKKGFTLIEVLASLAIASILLVSIYTIFGTNLKVIRKSYENELSYREATVGFTYVDNIIRSAYKIELTEDKGESNFKSYVINKNGGEISTYTFHTDISNGKRYLYAYIDNITNSSQRGSKIRIARCEDLYLYFDPSNQTIRFKMNKDNNDLSYQTLIYVDRRL